MIWLVENLISVLDNALIKKYIPVSHYKFFIIFISFFFQTYIFLVILKLLSFFLTSFFVVFFHKALSLLNLNQLLHQMWIIKGNFFKKHMRIKHLIVGTVYIFFVFLGLLFVGTNFICIFLFQVHDLVLCFFFIFVLIWNQINHVYRYWIMNARIRVLSQRSRIQ